MKDYRERFSQEDMINRLRLIEQSGIQEIDIPEEGSEEFRTLFLDIIQPGDIDIDWGESPYNSGQFYVVGGWRDVSRLNQEINRRLNPLAWSVAEPIYRQLRPGNNRWNSDTFSDLRLDIGANDRDRRYGSTYQKPCNLVTIDDLFGDNWGFSDEYTTCTECGKVVRTQPDHYGWQADYYIFGDIGVLACSECISEQYTEEYIEEHIGRNRLLNPDIVNPEEYGFIDLGLRLENGFHPGQADDPNVMIGVFANTPVQILFTGTVGQFDVRFTVLVRIDPEHKLSYWGTENPDLLVKYCETLISRHYRKPRYGPGDIASAALKNPEARTGADKAALKYGKKQGYQVNQTVLTDQGYQTTELVSAGAEE